MSFPFMPKRPAKPRAVDPEGRRLIALTLEGGEPIFAPGPHSITYAPSGAGKTTRVAMPALFSFVASDPEKAILISDPKDGEIAAQAIPMLARMGRKVALIDDLEVRPELAEYRIALNPFGAAVATWYRDKRDLIYANEGISNALIEEPSEPDMRNFYFRESPRSLIQFGNSAMLKRDPDLATPGAVSALLSDTDMLTGLAEIETEEGDPALQVQARAVLNMQSHEHFLMHTQEAARAMRHYGPGSRLEDTGRDAKLTHEELIRDGYVIFLAGPQSKMQHMGPLYALHLGAFTQALYQKSGALRIIADEFTNSPLKNFIGGAITTARSYSGEFHLIAQSRSDVLQKYGEHLTRTIEDNSATKQWVGGFGSAKEAEEISRSIGEEHAVATGLGGDSGGMKLNTNLSLVKQRHIPASELMAMKPDQQLVHIRGVGYFICRSIAQNQIAPYCDWLAPNPMEGGKLPSDPKVTLVTPEGGS